MSIRLSPVERTGDGSTGDVETGAFPYKDPRNGVDTLDTGLSQPSLSLLLRNTKRFPRRGN